MKHLKKALAIPVLLMFMFLFTACPYESKYALDGRKINYDPNILGNWEGTNKDQLVITRVSDTEFSFSYSGDEEESVDPAEGTGYIVQNDADLYFVLKQNDMEYPYLIYKIESITKNSMQVIWLDDSQATDRTFESSDQFSTFVLSEVNFAAEDIKEFRKVE